MDPDSAAAAAHVSLASRQKQTDRAEKVTGSYLPSLRVVPTVMRSMEVRNTMGTGFGSVAFSIGMALAAQIRSRLASRLHAWAITEPGLPITAASMLWLAQIDPHTTYWTHLAPAPWSPLRSDSDPP